MSTTISMRQILDELESGRVCSLTVVTYDAQRKTGGELRDIPEAVLLRATDRSPIADDKGRPLTTYESAKLRGSTDSRPPRHGYHFTRNLRLLENGQPTPYIRKIHVPLIVRFNGLPVAL